jgi:RNA polymerase sigma factor, sigma-70 family
MIASGVISTHGARVESLSIEHEAESAGRTWFRLVGDAELDRAYRLAGFLLGDAGEAEDATQDALARAWHRQRTLRSIDSAQAWFDRILVNVCRDRLRRRRIVRWVPLAGGESNVAADPFAEALARDSVLRGIATLDPDHRVVVALRFWADLSLEAIAERLGLPVGTVKSRLHYALRELRRTMDPGDEDR